MNVALVLFWILGFASTIGTPHETFYFWLPAAFLLAPLLIIFTDLFTRKRVDRPDAWGCIAGYGLFFNFVAILVYAMMAGGGV